MKRKSNILKGVQVQGLRLKEDDVLVVKYPVDKDGDPIHSWESTITFYNAIKDAVNCKVIGCPSDIEFLKVREDLINKNEK